MINSNIKILSSEPVSMVELKDMLGRIKIRDGELNFRSNKTMEYLEQFVGIQPKEAAELKNKLVKLDIPRLKEEHADKIVDLLPQSIDSLKVILQGYTMTVNQENMKKIVDLVREFTAKENK